MSLLLLLTPLGDAYVINVILLGWWLFLVSFFFSPTDLYAI